MTGKKLTIMAIALIVLTAIVFIQKQNSNPIRSTTNSNKTLLDDINLNTISNIKITKGNTNISLTKQDGKWHVTSLYDYPADFRKLAGAIQKIADTKLGEPIRANNIDKEELGLGKTATQIAIKTDNNKTITIDIGATRDATKTVGWANQHFIRKDGNDEIYLVDYDFQPFTGSLNDWIKKEILNISQGDIVAIKTDTIDLKLNGADWKLAGLKENEEIKPAEITRLQGALQYLNCTTIADPTKEDKDLEFDTSAVYIAKTKDGFTYTVKLGNKTTNGQYTRYEIAYNKPDAPAKPEKDATDEQKTDYEKELQEFNTTVTANETKAKKLNEQLSKWTYEIANYKADTFLITRDEIVKEKEPPKIEKQDDTNKSSQ